MDSLVIYPTTEQQSSLIQSLMKEMKVRCSVRKEKKKDDSLFTKEDYYAMLDERIKNAEQGNTVVYTLELEKELFDTIL